MTNKDNAFDLLRVLLAGCVLVTHAILIGGFKLQDPLAVFSKNQTNLGEFGVMGFFTLSGYLIAASFERVQNVYIFASHRLLRIFPGFWVCLILTAFIFAPLLYYSSGEPLAGYKLAGNGGAVNYVLNNFFLKVGQWTISDSLKHAAYPVSINGSLWSLYPEIQCYCFTIVAGACGLFQKNRVVFLICAISTLAFFSVNFNFSKTYGPTFLILSPALKLYTSYIAGSAIYVFRDRMILDKKGTIFLFIFTLSLLRFGGFNLISPFLIAMTLINVFQLFNCKFKYDFSYGMYIYGFPLQQLLFQVAGNRISAINFIGISFFIAALLGFLSYVLVEMPFIRLRRKTDPRLERYALSIEKFARYFRMAGNDKSNV